MRPYGLKEEEEFKLTRIDPARVRAHRSEPVLQSYDHRTTILYALGVGAGSDPEDQKFVYEKNLLTLPSQSVIMARERFWLHDPEYGIDVTKLLHGEQSVQIHKPLPAAGTIRGQLTVEALHDKGEGRGALLVMKREITDADSGDAIATVRITSFLRANGGFGGQNDPVAEPRPIPQRPAEMVVTSATTAEQALLYRLCGDDNPIHVDHEVARKAGFPNPILHGLCTYGVACRAVVQAVCGNDPERMKRFDVRFSRPVYPGDQIVTEIWTEEGGKAAHFRCWVPKRQEMVLNNGYAEISAS